jgi:hypothetical protein
VYKQGGSWHKSKTGIQSDPLLILGASAKDRASRLPQTELATLADSFGGIRKIARVMKDQTLYAGHLKPAAVKKLAPTEFAGVAQSGTIRFWINAKGLVVKYTITLILKGRRGNAEVDGFTTKTVTLDDPGSIKVEVPAEVQKLLK